MATIKAYTDISQSKTLSKILPLESADMYYLWYIEDDGDTIESGHRITTPNVGNFTTHKVNKMILPCWSLAALLGVLSDYTLESNKFYGKVALWCQGISVECDNIVDACYELILKLHELNLL